MKTFNPKFGIGMYKIFRINNTFTHQPTYIQKKNIIIKNHKTNYLNLNIIVPIKNNLKLINQTLMLIK